MDLRELGLRLGHLAGATRLIERAIDALENGKGHRAAEALIAWELLGPMSSAKS